MRRPGAAPLAVLAALAVGAMLAGCGDEPSYFGPAHVESNAKHAPATEDEAAEGAEVVRGVATQLYGPLAEEAGDGNLAYSPLSIATALGMTRAGATGDTAEQLDAFLGAADVTDIHRAINGADETLRGLDGPSEDAAGELRDVEMNTANALWGQSGTEWKEPFLDRLREDYDASMWTADYEGDPEAARADINDWVAEHTRERITDLLPPGSIDSSTRLVLTNALFFQAPWFEKFDEIEQPKPFTTLGGSEVEAPMMGETTEMPYVDGDGWQAVSIPYAGKKFAMTVIVPDEGEWDAVEQELVDGSLLTDAAAGDPAMVALTMPTFDIRTKAELRSALEANGITAPWAQDTKDFSPMPVEAMPLYLSNVQHQATVAVDEEGTVATAATGAVFNTTGAPITSEELVVDRPFFFVIHDITNDTPLMLGRITDPTATD